MNYMCNTTKWVMQSTLHHALQGTALRTLEHLSTDYLTAQT